MEDHEVPRYADCHHFQVVMTDGCPWCIKGKLDAALLQNRELQGKVDQATVDMGKMTHSLSSCYEQRDGAFKTVMRHGLDCEFKKERDDAVRLNGAYEYGTRKAMTILDLWRPHYSPERTKEMLDGARKLLEESRATEKPKCEKHEAGMKDGKWWCYACNSPITLAEKRNHPCPKCGHEPETHGQLCRCTDPVCLEIDAEQRRASKGLGR